MNELKKGHSQMLNIIKVITTLAGIVIAMNLVHWVVGYFIETVPVDVQTFLIFSGFVVALTAGLVAFNRYVK
jgi:hypothetical protein